MKVHRRRVHGASFRLKQRTEEDGRVFNREADHVTVSVEVHDDAIRNLLGLCRGLAGPAEGVSESSK